MSDGAPEGVSSSDWKSTVIDVGDWLWGTVEGAFNEKQSISQMIVESFAAGSPARAGGPAFWGLGEVPGSAERWRQGSAVLDEWNHDGFIIAGEVLPDSPPLRACTGVIAEQTEKRSAFST